MTWLADHWGQDYIEHAEKLILETVSLSSSDINI
jgi:hypothetical protein